MVEEKIEAIEEDEIDLLDLIKVIWKNRFLIVGTTIFITVLAVFVSIRMTEVYKSEMTFTAETEGSGGGMAALASSIPMASLMGVSGGGSTAGPNIVVIMESRSFREDVVRTLGLYDYYISKNEIKLTEIDEDEIPTIHDVARWLGDIVSVSKDDRTGVYKIEVEYEDPKKSVDFANGYFEELKSYLSDKNITTAKRNREYLERQVSIVEEKVRGQEEALREIEEKYNTVSIMEEANALTEIIASLKKNILTLNARLQVAIEFAGMQNIEVQRLQREIEVYRDQIEQLERGGDNLPISMISVSDIPNIKTQMNRLQREVKATASVYEMLLSQLEKSKLEEISDESVLNILDEAIVPKYPFKPNKKLNVVIGFILGGFLGIFIAFLKEFIKSVDWSQVIED